MSSTAPVKSNGSAVEDCPRDRPNTEPITGLKAGVQMLFSICVLCSMLSSCFYRQPTVASSSLIAQRACKLADGFLRTAPRKVPKHRKAALTILYKHLHFPIPPLGEWNERVRFSSTNCLYSALTPPFPCCNKFCGHQSISSGFSRSSSLFSMSMRRASRPATSEMVWVWLPAAAVLAVVPMARLEVPAPMAVRAAAASAPAAMTAGLPDRFAHVAAGGIGVLPAIAVVAVVPIVGGNVAGLPDRVVHVGASGASVKSSHSWV